MDNNFSSADLEFQQEVRAFFKSAYTPELQEKVESGEDHKSVVIEWQKKLNDQGWFAVDWPVEVGGTGWTPVQKFIFETERCEAGAPDVVPFGV
ncbi:MAG: alkylation response protein AidB-like acyl-CoA dehydrogenase [Arenicella sp.]|jgi:alkylation response protein AidB-like acyl-CoA dehydrogenase